MRKLRYCKKCGEVFAARGKFGRVCDKCFKNTGGWYKGKNDHPFIIENILGSRKYVYGAYDKEKKC